MLAVKVAVLTAAAAFVAAPAFTAADSAVPGFTAAAFTEVPFTVAAFAEVAFAIPVLAAVAFAEMDFTGIDFTIATSTTGFSFLTDLATRSFTIPIHTTDITPTATILTPIIRMGMDTVVFRVAVLAPLIFKGMVFMVVAFTGVALTEMDLTAMPPTVIGDSYDEHVYQCSAVHTQAKSRC